MKKILTLSLLVIAEALSLSLSGCSWTKHLDQEEHQIDLVVKEAEAETPLTVGDMAAYLENKPEHYPLSDEFIERYQQTSGGYIDYAKKTGHLVDREKHEPNQKWHFFTSWIGQSLEDGSLSMEDDGEKRVYKGLQCPELLLWIYEACEVDPVKVKNAKEVAEAGKVAGISTATMAKNMRECVSWADINNTIQNAKKGVK